MKIGCTESIESSHLISPPTPWILSSIPPWFPQGRNSYSGLPHTENKARLNLDSLPVSHFQEHREPAEFTHTFRATL